MGVTSTTRPARVQRTAAAAIGVLGAFHLLAGVVALVRGDVPSVPSATYTLPPATWGWTQVVLGVLVLLVALGVLRGLPAARLLGVVLAALGLVLNFLFLLLHPVWAGSIMVVQVLVVRALTVRWPERG